MSSIYSQPLEPHDPSNIDWINFENRLPGTIADLLPEYNLKRLTRSSRDLEAVLEEHEHLLSEHDSHRQHTTQEAGASRLQDSDRRRNSGRSASPKAQPVHDLVVPKTRDVSTSPAPAKSRGVMRAISGSLRRASAKVLRSASDESMKKKRQAIYGMEEAARKYGDVIGLGDKYLFAGVVPYEGT